MNKELAMSLRPLFNALRQVYQGIHQLTPGINIKHFKFVKITAM